MLHDESLQASTIEFAINVLRQAQQNLHTYDYGSAEIMVGVAKQVLEDLQAEFNRHSQTEEMLKQLLNQSSP